MDRIEVTLTLEGGLPEVSRVKLVFFGEGIGPSLRRVLVD